jgi:hypothetical protein
MMRTIMRWRTQRTRTIDGQVSGVHSSSSRADENQYESEIRPSRMTIPSPTLKMKVPEAGAIVNHIEMDHELSNGDHNLRDLPSTPLTTLRSLLLLRGIPNVQNSRLGKQFVHLMDRSLRRTCRSPPLNIGTGGPGPRT